MSNHDVGWVYILRTGWHYKIGKTKDVRTRVKSLQTASPYLVELVFAFYVDGMSQEERYWHDAFSDKRSSGEWFELSSEDIDKVKMQTLHIYDVCVGDPGDEENYTTWMDEEYTIHRTPKTPVDGVYFPTHKHAAGWEISYSTIECPHCKGKGELFNNMGGFEPRPITPDEWSSLVVYRTWRRAYDEELNADGASV